MKALVRRTIEKVGRSVAYAIKPDVREVHLRLADLRGLEGDPSSSISSLIDSGEPVCIARFGRTELQVASSWISGTLGGWMWKGVDSLASGDPYFYFHKSRRLLSEAGLNPLNRKTSQRFSELLRDSAREVDLLGSWAPGEGWFSQELAHSKLVLLADLEPYRHRVPWSRSLAGKRVLVVHPYTETITRQYETHRDALFGNKGVLPSFTLLTFKPPQAYFGEIRDAQDWFRKLDEMTQQIAGLNFDVAIIGAGPFGMPLAAQIKRLGRQAVHLGGATQLLFGVIGNRWLSDSVVQELMNPLWVRPLESETPPIAHSIERSAYW